MRSITFNNTTVDTLILNGNSDITINSPPENNTSVIENIYIDLQYATQLLFKTVSINGNFEDSKIIVNNDCVLSSDSSFICNNPINIDSNDSNIMLAGDFSNFNSGIFITGNIRLSTANTISLSGDLNFNITESSVLTLIGEFTENDVEMENNSTLILEGAINSLSSTDSNNNINLSLNTPDTSIDNITNISNVNLSGNTEAINNLPPNSAIFNITSVSYLVDFTNGTAFISPGSINTPGNYKISISVLSGDNKFDVSNTAIVNIT